MGSCCVCLSLVVSVTVLVLSSTLLGVGITDLTGEDAAPLEHLDGGQYRTEASWTTVYGAVGLLLCCITCCSPCRIWQTLLIGLVILLALFIAVRLDDITGQPAGGDLDDIAATMNRSIAEYTDDPVVEHAWDFVQQKLHCCGVTNISDWAAVLGAGHVPISCCGDDRAPAGVNCTALDGAYTEGCAVMVQHFIAKHRTWSVAVATAEASLLLLLLLGGCIAACSTDGGDSSEDPLPLLSAMSKAALDNRSNQLNPNNWRYHRARM